MKDSKKKKGSQGMWVLVLACIFSGIIGVLYSIWMMPYLEEHSVPVIFELVFIVVAFFIQTFIHEGGHLIFGLLTGYKFSSFRIFNLMILKIDGKLKFKKVHIAGTGGQCLMAPPENKEKKKFLLYNMGGCFLNIIASVIFVIVAIFSVNHPYLMTFSVSIVICGIIFALLNGIPLKTDAIPNDGYNTYLMVKFPSSVKAFWLQLEINRQISRGMRISQMPDDIFEMPTDEEMKNALFASIGVFRANRLVDEHKFDEAKALILSLLNADTAIVGVHENLLKCDLVYLELLSGNKTAAELLTKELKSFMKSMKNFPSVIRVNYALAISGAENTTSGDFYIKQFEKIAKSYPYPSDIISERELMEIANKNLQ